MINLTVENLSQSKTKTRLTLVSSKNQMILTALVFIIPSLVGFVTFYGVPVIRALLISFTKWDLLSPAKNVGFANYIKLFQDEEFWHALKVTLYYVLCNIPLETFLAIVIGVLMHRLTKSIVLRSIIILPWLISQVVAALIWQWLLDPQMGIVNAAMMAVGLPKQAFLGSVTLAIPSIAMINIWRHTGYLALLIFAGLQTIPDEIYEAAMMDGANEIRMFFSVTLQLLRPVIAFVLVTSVIGAFQVIDAIAVTTKGGPVDATRVIYWFIYQNSFEYFKFSYGATAAFVLFLMLIVISIFQMRVMRANTSDLA
jgi:multiple sugar transport system permease protein